MNEQNSPIPAVLLGLGRLPAQSKLGLLVAAAAIIALVTGSWMWSQVPDYRMLYANVSDRDGGAIIAALEQMNIPHKYSEGGGSIMVPAQHVHDARLKLASQGLPKGGTSGFELMENQKFGTTQFQEQVNYQRALEGELARTIQTLSAVLSARVHLAIPKPSVFLRDPQKPSASIVINLHPGRSLDRAQIAGVVHLVSSSVPELAPKLVSVIDQRGTLLSGAADAKGSGALDPGQISYVAQIESNYGKRITDILEPIVGRANVRAQVTAEVDFSESESMAERFKPNQNPADAAIRSQQTTEDARNGSSSIAQGIPGALSNQPAAPATAGLAGAPSGRGSATPPAGQGSGPQSRRDATVNYELDKTVQRTRNPNGSIKRLSAAVVINYRKPASAPTPAPVSVDDIAQSGEAVKAPPPAAKAVPMTAEEMQQITALVRESIGFSQARGDSVNVVNVAFSAEDPAEAVPEPALWQRPEVVAMAKEVGRDATIAAIAVFLFLFVLRPLLRQLAAAAPPPLIQADPQLESPSTQDGQNYAENLQAARQLARDDPKLVANVVRSWVGKDG